MKWKLSSFNIVIGKMYRAYPVAQGYTCKAGVTGDVGLIWNTTPVFLPEKFHGLRSLAGCDPWGHEESDTTERVRVRARARAHHSLSVVEESSYKHLSQFVCKVLFSINSVYSKTKGHKIKKLG